MILADY